MSVARIDPLKREKTTMAIPKRSDFEEMELKELRHLEKMLYGVIAKKLRHKQRERGRARRLRAYRVVRKIPSIEAGVDCLIGYRRD
jgi:hypothetical protein